VIFDAAIRIHLAEERALSVTFTPGGFSIRFPTTRRLAEFLGVPHYYVLPVFGQMEEGGLITRAERVGIMTTPAGARKFIDLVASKYRSDAVALLGEPIFLEIERRVRGIQGLPSPAPKP
jgi:DNA-binding transcriptional regulator YhcF (GntR family)